MGAIDCRTVISLDDDILQQLARADRADPDIVLHLGLEARRAGRQEQGQEQRLVFGIGEDGPGRARVNARARRAHRRGAVAACDDPG